ncbi:phosphatase/phosphohexomutase [Gluconacetobacter sacchari DSM 12717]|uniref:HAD family phosphatase n=2 Tax=Gluconacetobacter sacchari TaxID=92759 RepID=A0A7W4NPA2_9PROT|nr:HAD family phosphatase [Gluconacetobacter sacchari]MBB2161504.1 HAD family phosphatase [Gluconacetobacter sacchari]GBQ30866.1 phosphatase/phosphohexomutase [Gluconacetobacter sacchari DSM 12717]
MIVVPPGTTALIFDCDGTLVDTLPLYLQAWLAALRSEAAHEVAPDWFRGRGGLSEHMVLDLIETELGRPLDRPAILRAARGALLSAMDGLREIAVVADLARRYRGTLPMAVASSGSREIVMASLTRTELLDLFDCVVTIDDVARPKPAPDLFLEAARRLGAVPDCCLVLEDSAEGLAAAGHAGMQGVDVRPFVRAAAGPG